MAVDAPVSALWLSETADKTTPRRFAGDQSGNWPRKAHLVSHSNVNIDADERREEPCCAKGVQVQPVLTGP